MKDIDKSWYDFEKEQPKESGYYEVEDRTGRRFVTWYEKTINGFDMMCDGVGYKIIQWRKTDD